MIVAFISILIGRFLRSRRLGEIREDADNGCRRTVRNRNPQVRLELKVRVFFFLYFIFVYFIVSFFFFLGGWFFDELKYLAC